MDNRNIWTTNGGNENHDSITDLSRTPTAISTISRNNHNTNKNNKNNFFQPYPNLVGVQSKFRRNYYQKVIYGSLICFIIILIIIIIVLATKEKYFGKICESKECLRTASSLLLTMDQTMDPCEDFYQFTCGNWAEEHPRPDSLTTYDWFSERQAKIMRKIRKFLQANETRKFPDAVNKARQIYKGCMDTEQMNTLSMEPLMFYLNKFHLPKLPSILNITTIANGDVNYKFNWIKSLVAIKKTLGMDIILGFDIFPDPGNRSLNMIAIGTPESGSELPFNDEDNHRRLKKAKKKFISEIIDSDDNDDDNDEDNLKDRKKKHNVALAAYISYIKKVIAVIIVYLDSDKKLEDAYEDADSATRESIDLSKKIYKFKEAAENSTKKSKNPLEDLLYVNLYKLENLTSQLIQPKTLPIWTEYLEGMFNNETINYNIHNETLLTSKTDIMYLQLLAEYIIDIPQEKLEFFLWINIVEELILHTTSDMRELHNDYMRLIINTEGGTIRSMYCTNGVNSLMGMAVSYAVADKNFVPNTLPKVEIMLNNIRESFNDLVRSTNWMDKQTKDETLRKSAQMRSFIGFPDWILNHTILDEYYENITVNVTTHLDNLIGILKWQMNKKLRNLLKPNEFGWATSPSNVNAFHTFQANTITVPIAILQYPFYELGLEALNYGAIGTILGHELTHGFDDSGRMFDHHGNMRQWWTNATINEYVNRTECFVDQYAHYYLQDVGEYVNGELTLGENIADNGGLREAFYAYRRYVKSAGKEKLLPGLEKFSHEQLLFISFGNLWCETYTPAGTRYALEDSHCPGKIRLKGVLSNSPEFAKTFGCKKNSGMYPSDDRCRIW